ncbi:glycosyl transferase family 2 [Streptomyces clavuligerus]|uniref:Glycosyl transferase, family 2 n=1 Tax=Streptomyces clavuligerus TaxID=1901 RepID=E2PZC3_STRCL|nr:glycosyl transferase family 2 [Streptomyces clavuligerus]AXU11700.1 methyltransferase domain-containing protein [Streptomyces clavuligerus]EFG10384.1 Glycosyl transferase, family 2 [Streptomyces clavuligerus]QCS04480.1 methyltransferase domain-containing protein [Streptomyces clavuligerus]QPJ96139.1 methyltransferase domain-containing protein [Streptomyces clavuligerus]
MMAWALRKLEFDPRTVSFVEHDVARLRARLRQRRWARGTRSAPVPRGVHLGCGARRVPGWLNCDVSGSECDIDLAAGRLPFADGSVDAVVMQHVVEHLELKGQLIPLLRELYRVCSDDAVLWLSCPDLAKVCAAYTADRGRALKEDRCRRWPDYSLDGAPVQQFVNDLFQARGRHRNLFDLELLAWALEQAGFRSVERIAEADLLAAHPGFPPRHDDEQSLYVRVCKSR